MYIHPNIKLLTKYNKKKQTKENHNDYVRMNVFMLLYVVVVGMKKTFYSLPKLYFRKRLLNFIGCFVKFFLRRQDLITGPSKSDIILQRGCCDQTQC